MGRFRSSTPLIFAGALGAPGLCTAAGGDAVKGICLDGSKAGEPCEGAPEGLKPDVGAKDYAVHEMVGARSLAAKSKDVGISEAWDSAVNKAVGERGAGHIETLSRSSKFGKAHRVAMKACGS